jgi:hypothetical protein
MDPGVQRATPASGRKKPMPTFIDGASPAKEKMLTTTNSVGTGCLSDEVVSYTDYPPMAGARPKDDIAAAHFSRNNFSAIEVIWNTLTPAYNMVSLLR